MDETLRDYGDRVNDELADIIRAELGRRGWTLRELSRRLGDENNPQHVAARLSAAPRSDGKRRTAIGVSDVIRIGSALGIPGAELVRRAKAAADGEGGATVTPIKPKPAPVAPAVQTRAARRRQGKPKMGDE
jgi:hypothetical protein